MVPGPSDEENCFVELRKKLLKIPFLKMALSYVTKFLSVFKYIALREVVFEIIEVGERKFKGK